VAMEFRHATRCRQRSRGGGPGRGLPDALHRPTLGDVQLASKLVEEIQAVATESPGVERVWLFGSRARDEATPRADIDLAVECPTADAADFARVSLRLSEIETLLPVDVVRLEEAGVEMSRRVLRDGVLLYER